MKYCEGNYLIYDSDTGFRASDLTAESLELIGGTAEVKLEVHESTGLILPYLKNKKLGDPNNYNIAKWFESVIENSDKRAQGLAGLSKQLSKKGVSFTQEDLDAIIDTPIKLDNERTSPVSEKLLKYTVGNMQASTVLGRRVLVDDAKYKYKNETLIQNKNTDKVGLYLPEAKVITSHILGEAYATIPFMSTYSQYPNRLYYTKQISAILLSKSAQIRLENINKTLDALKSVYDIEVPDREIRQLQTGFEVLPIEHVIGTVENDTVEIQSNEEEFYSNLVEFIRYHIHKFNKEIMTNSSEEEIEEKATQDFNSGVLPVRLTEYLEQMLYDILTSNFGHTGNFNDVVGAREDDTGEMSDKAAVEDKMGIIITKENPMESDLHFVASNYLTISARNLGATMWAEGIVKIMRWGDRKVRNLNVGLNNTQYLDLQSMKLVTQQLADLSNFEVDKDSKGRSLEVLATAYCEFKPKDSKRAKSYPFLLIGYEYGYIPESDEAIPVTYLTTLFDIVNDYIHGKGIIFDLSFVNGKFVSDNSNSDVLQVYSLEDLTIGSRKIKISEELTDYGIDNGISKMHGTAFSILKQDELDDYKSSEPLLNRLVDTAKPFRTNVIQGGLLSIFQEGAENFESTDLVSTLNWYYENVYPIHLNAYNKLFGFIEKESANAGKLNVKNLPTANFFGIEQAEEKEEKEEPRFMFKTYEGEELTFNKITKKKDDDTVVGGYAKLPDGTMVFASVDEVVNFAISGPPVHMGQVLLFLFEIQLTADTATTFSSKNLVVSQDTTLKLYSGLVGKV